MTKISVIVTVYNIEKYIEKALESILSQTFKDFEVVVIDDGSQDSSGEICDKFANRDSRIKVIHKENGGLVRARKTGLETAQAPYIVYVDGDDWIEVDALEKMYSKVIEDASDVTLFGHYQNTQDKQKAIFHNVEAGVYDKARLQNELYPHMISNEKFYEWQVFSSLWDSIFKKDLLEKSQFLVDDRISMGEDAACKYPLLLMANRVSFVHEAYYHYRQTSDSMIKKAFDKTQERERYRLLFTNVMSRFDNLKSEYDLTNQWVDFMLFSMLTRANLLYDDIEKLSYVFPFRNLPRHSKIALYGAGTYGQLLYKYFTEEKVCDVAAWVDRNFEQLRVSGLEVDAPDSLSRTSVDYVVVASMFEKDRSEICKYLESLDLDAKICAIEPEFVRSTEVKRGFKLI